MSDMRVNSSPPGYSPEQQPQAAAQPDPRETVKDKDMETIQEMIKESREKVKERQAQLDRAKPKPRYGDAPLEAYARLARAKSQSQVSMAAGYARSRMAQLRSALRQDEENAGEIKAALRQLQKAVSRAGKKKQELQREQLQEARREKLEEEQQRQRAQRLKQELRRSKMMRAFRESGYMREAVTDSQQQQMLSATRAELRQQAQALSDAFGATAEYAAQQYTAGAADAATSVEAAPAAVDVQA